MISYDIGEANLIRAYSGKISWYAKPNLDGSIANGQLLRNLSIWSDDSQPVIRVPLVVREGPSGGTRVDYFFEG